MTDLRDFPRAPEGSFVNEDGWLIVGEEAWTLREWLTYPDRRPSPLGGGRYPQRGMPRYQSDEERREARRRSSREYMRRKRAAGQAA